MRRGLGAYNPQGAEGGVCMRTGRVSRKRYQVRRRGWGYAAVLAAGIIIGAAALALRQGIGTAHSPLTLLSVPAAPSRPPEETQPQERLLTLPGRAWFALSLGGYDTPEGARAQAEAYQSRGAGGYLYKTGNYQALAAVYASRADAVAVKNQLWDRHQVETAVTEIVQPEVTLRLSGQKGQLTALSDACDALDQLSGHLSALSAALDQRAQSVEEALAALQSERDPLNALSRSLTDWFGDSPPAPVRSVKTLLDDLARSLEECQGAKGSTALGAKVKYAQLQCVCRMADYAAALGAGKP